MTNLWQDPADYQRFASGIQAHNAQLLVSRAADFGPFGEALDAGCGTGFVMKELAKKRLARKILGIDLSQEMLTVAQSQLESLSGIEIELKQLLMQEAVSLGKFDLVISNAALHWTYPDLDRSCASLAGAIRAGGIMAIGTAGRSAASDEFDEMISAAIVLAGGTLADEPFAAKRITPDALVAMMEVQDIETYDAFLVERGRDLSASEYATWVNASGKPWQTLPGGLESLVSELVKLAPIMKCRHWTTFAFGRKR